MGGLSDCAARQMTVDQSGKMYCLAGIGGRVEGIMANTKAAAAVLVIDGCSQECARKTMELAGFKDFQHLRLAEMGFKKGETPLTPGRIREVAAIRADELGLDTARKAGAHVAEVALRLAPKGA